MPSLRFLSSWSTHRLVYVCNGPGDRSEYTVICNSHHRPEDRPCHGCRSLYCLQYLIWTATSVSSGNMGSRPFSILYTAFLIQESRQSCTSSFVTLCGIIRRKTFPACQELAWRVKPPKCKNTPATRFRFLKRLPAVLDMCMWTSWDPCLSPKMLISFYYGGSLDPLARSSPNDWHNGRSCVSAMMNGWISHFGSPEVITTDRDRPFTSGLWQSFVRLLGSFAPKTNSYHPQANGLVERFHRSLKASLMASSDKASGNWVEELPAVLLRLQSTVKEGLGTSAAEAVYGKPLRLPGSLVSTPTDPPSPAFVDDVRRHAYGLSFIPATRHGSEGVSCGLKALRAASHILVRQVHVRPPLTWPYKGPYRVISRSLDYFTLDLDGREDSISISRIIPCRSLTETVGPSPTTTRSVNPRLKPSLRSTTSPPMI